VVGVSQDKIVIWPPQFALITHCGGTGSGTLLVGTNGRADKKTLHCVDNTPSIAPTFLISSGVRSTNPRGLWQFFDMAALRNVRTAAAAPKSLPETTLRDF
jgi:hypothetical protein